MAKKVDEQLGGIEDVLKQINKDFGSGAVMMLGESPTMQLEVIPSGSLALDHALGVGGYPLGRIIEIYGPESSGKTTLAIHAVAEAQKMGLQAAYIDAEHAFDREYAAGLGVDVNHLLFAQPDYGEQGLEIADRLISSGKVGILVIDSVAALVPKAEIDGEMGQSNMALQARLMSQALRKLTGTIKKNNTCVIFINQLRDKVGVMFGNPETTTGGNALKFYATIRIDIRRISQVKDGDDITANMTRAKIVKNKVAPPFRKAEFMIEFGKGINKEAEIVDMAVEFDIIHKSGSWFSYEDAKICQGRDNLISLMNDNPEFKEEVEAKVHAHLENKPSGVLELEDVLGTEI